MIRNEPITWCQQKKRAPRNLKWFSRMSLLVLAIGAAVICARPSLAADTDTIDTVSSDGDHIIMQSGQVYESDDAGTSSTWESGDDVVITGDDTIINTDEGGESVDAVEE